MKKSLVVLGLLIVMVLAGSGAARAAVEIDPGYEAGEAGLELTLGYSPLMEAITFDGYWAVGEQMGVSLYSEYYSADLYRVQGGISAVIYDTWYKLGLEYVVAPSDYGNYYFKYFFLQDKTFGEQIFLDVSSRINYFSGGEFSNLLDSAVMVGLGWRNDVLLVIGGIEYGIQLNPSGGLQNFCQGFLFLSAEKQFDAFTAGAVGQIYFDDFGSYTGELNLSYAFADWGSLGGSVNLLGDWEGYLIDYQASLTIRI